MIASFFTTVDPWQFSVAFTFQVLILVIIGEQPSVTSTAAAAALISAFLEWARIFDSGVKMGELELPGIPGPRVTILSLAPGVVITHTRDRLLRDREFGWSVRLEGMQRLAGPVCPPINPPSKELGMVFMNLHTVMHPPGTILNAGRIAYTNSGF